MKFALLALVGAAVGPAAAAERVTMARRAKAPREFAALETAAQTEGTVKFTVWLKEQNLDKLDATFHAVSDPANERYGQHLTKQQIDDLVRSPEAAFQAVNDWLAGSKVETVVRATSVEVKASKAVASALLQTSFGEYKHKKSGRVVTLAVGEVSVPKAVAEYVDFVGGLTESWKHYGGAAKKTTAARAAHKADKSAASTDIEITPDVLRSYYNVPASEASSNSKNLQCIAAFNDYYSADALTAFNSHFSLPTPTLTAQGVDCLTNYTQKPCDEVESDLDVQYITALGRGVDTLFHNQNEGWVLEFSEQAQELTPFPKVFSISYGWAELKQCDIAFETCDNLGYDARKYVARTNVGFQKLGTMGASVFVSDGDDGAQSVQPDGADPIDLNRWCGASEYTCYPKTTSKCAELLLHNTTTGQTCPWPVGSEGDLCEWTFLGGLYQVADIIKKIQDANQGGCNTDIYYDFDYGVHFWSDCECGQIKPFNFEGMTTEAFKFNSSAKLFYADFPTASPYVTSVGATLFKSDDGKTVKAEHACSIVDGGIITTGGGFSDTDARPSWQAAAVDSWDQNAPAAAKPPSNQYNVKSRGYPDVSLNGHNYAIYSTSSKNADSVSIGHVDGTSASSPALAGLISLINGARLDAGKSAVGFVNPLLYSMYAAQPQNFHDISFGDNKCTRNFCMEYGYNATQGWDPVGGLGSIDYTALKKYAMAQ